MHFKRSLFFLILLLSVPVLSSATIPRQMAENFKNLSGVIIMPIGDEYLIDLDASVNLRKGDILTLVIPGEKVIHPVTKEVLGTLDIPKGFLQVTRIKSGYSYAKLLYSDVPPKKGDQLKRYEQVPTIFTASPADNKLFSELRAGLPQLNWLDKNSTTKAVLIFSLKNNMLTVKDADGTVLNSYPLVNGELRAPRPTAGRSTAFDFTAAPDKNKSSLNKAVNEILGSIGLTQTKERDEDFGIIRTQQNKGIWMSRNLQGSPVGIVVADLDNDGKQETAVAMQNRLLINQINQGNLNEEAVIEFPAWTKCLSIDTIDLNGDGTDEIYLTGTKDRKLTSFVIEFVDGKYRTSIKNIPWFMRVAKLPGEGRVLIGQTTGDVDSPFYDTPFRIVRSGNKLQRGADVILPGDINMYSFLPFTSDTGEQLYAYLTLDDYLKVIDTDGNERWESGEYFGGSETDFYNVPDDVEDLIDPIYIQQRILQAPSGEILVAKNDGLRILSRTRLYKSSRVIAMTWSGFALQESWRTSGQNGYMADFALADADNDGVDEVVMVVKFKHKGLLQDARSAIVIYELQ
ncbi:MAG: VCBS repeat-containing protein [Deltaproteobacteria bacterium]|nr:VCBS repeat-containing protein [Deltaproteobacteria bacterium]